MDRQVALLRLARRLAAAAADKDWETLGRVDRELAAALPQLAAHGAWSPAEQRALDELQRAHAAAQADCLRETAEAGRRLGQMRESKEGWMAYAMNEEWQESRT